jgi:acetolactate synthase-1/2/3 large subunit
MRVCDFIAEKLYEYGVRNVYGLMGGGAAGLNDGFIKNGKLKYICFHHEQGAGHAAIGEAKYTNNLAVVNPTTGCGGTNCATSVLNAWQDSVPVLFISGNVRQDQTARVINSRNLGKFKLRKFGLQEHDVIRMYENMTKFSHFIQTVEEVPYILAKAIYMATSGRKGPVWLDIPADIQVAQMEQKDIDAFRLDGAWQYSLNYDNTSTRKVYDQMLTAKRPLVLAGNGVSLSGANQEFMNFCNAMQLPFVTTFASDVAPKKHTLNVGTIGIKGSRAANFAIQNCDLLIVIGCSLNVSHKGYDPALFAPKARMIIVDIDKNELDKQLAWMTIQADAKQFLKDFEVHAHRPIHAPQYEWIQKCHHWKTIWPTIDKKQIEDDSNGIDIYALVHAFNEHMYPDDNYVIDAGQAYYAMPTSLSIGEFGSEKLLVSLGQADMGWAVPGSIGAALAAPDKNIIAYVGDGSFYSNMQELAVAKYHKLRIKFVVGNNNGYASIRNTQTKFYEGRVYGESAEHGLYFAPLESVARAFGMKYYKITKYDSLMEKRFHDILHSNEPAIIEVMLKQSQDILPTMAMLPNGKQGALHQMYPFLSDEEMEKEMMVKL